MLAVTLADLSYRARQFLIAIVGVGLVLAMALLLAGLSAGFQAEVNGTVNGVGADSWVLSTTSQGRITAFAAFPELQALVVAHEPGVTSAAPLLVLPFQVSHIHGNIVTINVAGVVPGRLGDPVVTSGHRIDGPRQMVADVRLKEPIGTAVVLGDRIFHVVGTVTNRTLVGGVPMTYVPLASAQQVATQGQPLITAVVTRGVPRRVPANLMAFSPAQAAAATVGQLKTAAASINNTRWLMWTVAIIIVGSLLYVAALERRRDFAVLKALGSSSRALFFSLVLESLVVTLVATALAEVAANFLTSLFTQPVDITATARLTLPIIAILVGVISSFSALRRVTGADPAGAFA